MTDRQNAQFSDYRLSWDVPDGWFAASEAVPALLAPRQLACVSNRPILPVPVDSDQPRPMVAHLDDAAILVWIYYQSVGYPEPSATDPLPNYSFGPRPLHVDERERFDGAYAREWDPKKLEWSRIGMRLHSETALTIWLWEGVAADSASRSALARFVSSVAVTERTRVS